MRGFRSINSIIRLFDYSIIASALLTGCQSYTIVQRNVFADDDGNTVVVNYGRSDSDHVNMFVSPATGKEMEFRSKLMVKVELPDGDIVKAWQCMNFLPRGTLYESDDGEWKVLANGFSVVIYHQTGEPAPHDYLEVYRGVICEVQEMEIKKNDKWRDLTPRSGGITRREKPQGK